MIGSQCARMVTIAIVILWQFALLTITEATDISRTSQSFTAYFASSVGCSNTLPSSLLTIDFGRADLGITSFTMTQATLGLNFPTMVVKTDTSFSAGDITISSQTVTVANAFKQMQADGCISGTYQAQYFTFLFTVSFTQTLTFTLSARANSVALTNTYPYTILPEYFTSASLDLNAAPTGIVSERGAYTLKFTPKAPMLKFDKVVFTIVETWNPDQAISTSCKSPILAAPASFASPSITGGITVSADNLIPTTQNLLKYSSSVTSQLSNNSEYTITFTMINPYSDQTIIFSPLIELRFEFYFAGESQMKTNFGSLTFAALTPKSYACLTPLPTAKISCNNGGTYSSMNCLVGATMDVRVEVTPQVFMESYSSLDVTVSGAPQQTPTTSTLAYALSGFSYSMGGSTSVVQTTFVSPFQYLASFTSFNPYVSSGNEYICVNSLGFIKVDFPSFTLPIDVQGLQLLFSFFTMSYTATQNVRSTTKAENAECSDPTLYYGIQSNQLATAAVVTSDTTQLGVGKTNAIHSFKLTSTFQFVSQSGKIVLSFPSKSTPGASPTCSLNLINTVTSDSFTGTVTSCTQSGSTVTLSYTYAGVSKINGFLFTVTPISNSLAIEYSGEFSVSTYYKMNYLSETNKVIPGTFGYNTNPAPFQSITVSTADKTVFQSAASYSVSIQAPVQINTGEFVTITLPSHADSISSVSLDTSIFSYTIATPVLTLNLIANWPASTAKTITFTTRNPPVKNKDYAYITLNISTALTSSSVLTVVMTSVTNYLSLASIQVAFQHGYTSLQLGNEETITLSNAVSAKRTDTTMSATDLHLGQEATYTFTFSGFLPMPPSSFFRITAPTLLSYNGAPATPIQLNSVPCVSATYAVSNTQIKVPCTVASDALTVALTGVYNPKKLVQQSANSFTVISYETVLGIDYVIKEFTSTAGALVYKNPCDATYFCNACSTFSECTTCFPASTIEYPSSSSKLTEILLDQSDVTHSFDNCVTTCPAGSYQTTSSGLQACLKCNPNCFKCVTTSTFCTACTGSLYLDTSTNTCVSPCPSGYYCNRNAIEGSLNTCLICSAFGNCLTCTAASVCQTCLGGFLLQGTSCVSSCSVGYYQNGVECSLCPTGCSACTSLSICTSCISTYVKYNDSCLTSCPAGQSPLMISGILQCGTCDANCKTCYSTQTQCTSCHANTYLYGSKCILKEAIPEGSYGDTSNWVVASCMSYCKVCTYSSACTTCISSAVIYKGVCQLSCPNDAPISDGNGGCKSSSTISTLNESSRLIPFPMLLSCIAFSISVYFSKYEKPQTFVPGCVVGFCSFFEWISWIILMYITYTNDSLNFTTGLAIAGFLLIYVFNIVCLVIFRQTIMKDPYFVEWKAQPKNSTCFKIVLVLSVLFTFKIQKILFCKYFNQGFFKAKLKDIDLLSPFNKVSILSVILNSFSIILSAAVFGYNYQNNTQLFILSLDTLFVTLFLILFMVWEALKNNNFFEENYNMPQAFDTSGPSRMGCFPWDQSYQDRAGQRSVYGHLGGTESNSNLNEFSEAQKVEQEEPLQKPMSDVMEANGFSNNAALDKSVLKNAESGAPYVIEDEISEFSRPGQKRQYDKNHIRPVFNEKDFPVIEENSLEDEDDDYFDDPNQSTRNRMNRSFDKSRTQPNINRSHLDKSNSLNAAPDDLYNPKHTNPGGNSSIYPNQGNRMNSSSLGPVNAALAEDEEMNGADDIEKERTIFYQPKDGASGVASGGPRVSTGVAISHPNYDNHKLEERLKQKAKDGPSEPMNAHNQPYSDEDQDDYPIEELKANNRNKLDNSNNPNANPSNAGKSDSLLLPVAGAAVAGAAVGATAGALAADSKQKPKQPTEQNNNMVKINSPDASNPKTSKLIGADDKKVGKENGSDGAAASGIEKNKMKKNPNKLESSDADNGNGGPLVKSPTKQGKQPAQELTDPDIEQIESAPAKNAKHEGNPTGVSPNRGQKSDDVNATSSSSPNKKRNNLESNESPAKNSNNNNNNQSKEDTTAGGKQKNQSPSLKENSVSKVGPQQVEDLDTENGTATEKSANKNARGKDITFKTPKDRMNSNGIEANPVTPLGVTSKFDPAADPNHRNHAADNDSPNGKDNKKDPKKQKQNNLFEEDEAFKKNPNDKSKPQSGKPTDKNTTSPSKSKVRDIGNIFDSDDSLRSASEGEMNFNEVSPSDFNALNQRYDDDFFQSQQRPPSSALMMQQQLMNATGKSFQSNAGIRSTTYKPDSQSMSGNERGRSGSQIQSANEQGQSKLSGSPSQTSMVPENSSSNNKKKQSVSPMKAQGKGTMKNNDGLLSSRSTNANGLNVDSAMKPPLNAGRAHPQTTNNHNSNSNKLVIENFDDDHTAMMMSNEPYSGSQTAAPGIGGYNTSLNFPSNSHDSALMNGGVAAVGGSGAINRGTSRSRIQTPVNGTNVVYKSPAVDPNKLKSLEKIYLQRIDTNLSSSQSQRSKIGQANTHNSNVPPGSQGQHAASAAKNKKKSSSTAGQLLQASKAGSQDIYFGEQNGNGSGAQEVFDFDYDDDSHQQ